MKTFLVIIALLAFSVSVQAQQLTSDQMGFTRQNTFCVETVKGRHKGQPVWLVWQTTQCRPRVSNPQPSNRLRVTVEEYARRNILDRNDLVIVHPRNERKFAHAQQKPAVIVPPIPVPEPEAAQLKALEADAAKAQTEFQQKMKELQADWKLITARAAVRAKLSIDQLDTLSVQPDGKGGLAWTVKPEPPKTAKVN